MLNRFVPRAAPICVSVSLPAHTRAQLGAAGDVRGRIVESVRNQRVHGTAEADTAGELSFDRVPEGVKSVEVEERGYAKAVQADVPVVLRRASAIDVALVRGRDKAGAGNLTSRGLHLIGPTSHARWAFMATVSNSRSRLS